MFYPKCLNIFIIYTIIIARSNKNNWMKYVYVVGFVLIKYMLNKSYEELRFYVGFRGICGDSLVLIEYSLVLIEYSLVLIEYSLVLIEYSLVLIEYSLVLIEDSLLLIEYSLLLIEYSLVLIEYLV